MVLVDVFVPSVNKKYDFYLDEYSSICTIIEEISEMIAQKEHCEMDGKINDLFLCDVKNRVIFSTSETLHKYKIVSGSQLLFV
jgi:hypothetical protein